MSYLRTSLCTLAAFVGLASSLPAAPLPLRLSLPGHVPALASLSNRTKTTVPSEQIALTICLPLRNQAALHQQLIDLYNPQSANFHHYLAPRTFAQTYGPTEADYNRVIAWARSQGLTVTATHPERTLLEISGSAAHVQSAFAVHLDDYQSPGGRAFHAPASEPSVPISIAGLVRGVVGLNNAAVLVPNAIPKPVASVLAHKSDGIGSGPLNGLTPQDIRTVYGLNGTGLDGSGQTLAVFEVDSYTPRDVQRYERAFGLPNVPLQNILVDTADSEFPRTPGAGTGEVVLDIDMQIALAPKAAKVMVYIAPNTAQGWLDNYQRIADDNQATSISTSWGIWEDELIGIDPATRYPSVSPLVGAENQIFLQMAMQGQTIFSATGDYGGVDMNDGSPTAFFAQDPATQPYMCSVGGTSLSVVSPSAGEKSPAYFSETSWNTDGDYRDGAAGGGVSIFWPLPDYQQTAAVMAPFGSSVSQRMRNTPDVSLNADPANGYTIYISDPIHGAKYYVSGGTSCAAPLWAGFTALVNQSRAQNGAGPIGFINPALYSIFSDPAGRYADDFHDVADGSSNIPYPAVPGYDLSTGLGSFQGANLIADLTSLH